MPETSKLDSEPRRARKRMVCWHRSCLLMGLSGDETMYRTRQNHVALFMALALIGQTACQTLNTQKEKGAVIGAAGGAAVGAVIGNATGSTARGAIIGAAVGG